MYFFHEKYVDRRNCVAAVASIKELFGRQKHNKSVNKSAAFQQFDLTKTHCKERQEYQKSGSR